MKSLVSVIVPVYNVQQYLPICLDSLMHQTHANLDIILIDDGSSDSSGAICDACASRDSRIRVIHQANAGASNAKNAGLDLARGEYIAFVDSDDWVEPDWVEKMLNAAAVHGADVVECDFRAEYLDGSEPGNIPNSFGETCFDTEAYLRHYPTQWTCALFWNKLFRAPLLSSVRFHTERRCVDDEFFTYKVITGANIVLRISDVLYHYRQRRSSVTQSEKTLYQRTIDDIDILAERHQWMKHYYPDLSMDYLRHDVDTLLYLCNTYPFNDAAIAQFRSSALYYFKECLRRFPGKVTMYYAFRALTYPKKNFSRTRIQKAPEDFADRYYP